MVVEASAMTVLHMIVEMVLDVKKFLNRIFNNVD